MIFNHFNRFHPLYAPDPEGLTARLAAAVSGGTLTAEPGSGDLPTNGPPAPAPNPAPEPKKDDPAPENQEDDDFQFHVIGGEKPPEKPPEAFDEKAFDEETNKSSEGMDEKASDKFKRLRAELKTFKQREFKPDLNTIPEYTSLQTEVEELRKKAEENDGLRSRLDSVMKSSDELAVKESPEFIRQVTEPTKEIDTALAALAPSTGMSHAELQALISEQDPAKQDAMLAKLEAKIPRRTLSRIERFCDDYKVIAQAEQQLLKDIPASLATSRQQEQQRAEENRKALTGQFQNSTRQSFKDYAQAIPGLTDSSGVLTATAQEAQNAAVSIDPHQLTPDDLGFAIFASKALPLARKAILRLQKENEALRAGRPAPTIPGAPPTPAPKPGKDDPKPNATLSERLKHQQENGGFSFNPSMVQ